MDKQSSQFDFNDFTEVRQAQFDALILPGELQNQIETDYNEIHAMYPFLPVDPPILQALLLTPTTTPTVIQVPTSAKLMRLKVTDRDCAYTISGGAAIADNTDGVGWVLVPLRTTTGWIYCGHTQQVAVAVLSGTCRLSIEFAGMHARVKK